MKRLGYVGVILLFVVIGLIFGGRLIHQFFKPDISQEVKLVWCYPGIKQPDNDLVQEELNKLLKTKINATVELHPLPIGDYEQTKGIVISSGDNYDLTFVSSWLNKVRVNVEKGALADMTPLLNKYAPKTKASLPDYVLNNIKFDGKIYCMPNQQIMYQNWGYYIPKDLIAKYKFDISTVPVSQGVATLRALEPFLEKIRDNEPNLYPYRVFSPGSKYENVVFGKLCIDRYNTKDIKVLNSLQTQQKMDWDKLIKEYMKRGFIRKDILTMKSDAADVDNQKYAVENLTIKPGGLAELEAKRNREYMEIPIDKPYILFEGPFMSATAISSGSKNKERAMMLIELMNTDKQIYNTISFGVEGIHYTKVSDNAIKQVENTKYNPNSAWMFGNQFNAYLLPGQSPSIWEDTKKGNHDAVKSPLLGINFNYDLLKNHLAQLTAVEQEYSKIQYIDNPTMYNTYLDKLNKAGINELQVELQKQIDNWIKNKK